MGGASAKPIVRIIAICALLILCTQIIQAKTPPEDRYYDRAFSEIAAMLDGDSEVSVKRASFLLEWAYLQGEPDYKAYCDSIASIARALEGFIILNGLYKNPIGRNMALFEFFSDPNPLNSYRPYTYDFDDFMGERDYSNFFATKLMRTHTGQCRSFPLFYKILADEIGADVCIAYAPNHSYIKHPNGKGGWINVELTNHSLPRDVFIIETNGITQRAIETGIYTKPCGDREIVISLLADLADGYMRLYGYWPFVVECTEKVLEYDPDNLQGLMQKNNYLYLKAASYARHLASLNSPPDTRMNRLDAELKAVTDKITSLGYIDMPENLYNDWIESLREETERQQNTQNN